MPTRHGQPFSPPAPRGPPSPPEPAAPLAATTTGPIAADASRDRAAPIRRRAASTASSTLPCTNTNAFDSFSSFALVNSKGVDAPMCVAHMVRGAVYVIPSLSESVHSFQIQLTSSCQPCERMKPLRARVAPGRASVVSLQQQPVASPFAGHGQRARAPA